MQGSMAARRWGCKCNRMEDQPFQLKTGKERRRRITGKSVEKRLVEKQS